MTCRNHPKKREWNGNTGICNDCAAEEGKRLYDEQKGKCAICDKFLGKCDAFGKVPSAAKLDHNHDSGQIRGVLCNNCNLGLGNLKHDLTLLRKAAAYLEKWKQIARE